MKKILFALFSITIFLVSCKEIEYKKELTEQEIQTEFAKKFPFEKDLLIAKIKISNPELKIVQDKIQIKVDFSEKYNPTLAGSFSFEGIPYYDPKNTSVYLKDFHILQTTFNTEEINDPNFEHLVEKVAKNVLAEFPIYRLKSDSFKKAMAKLTLKSMEVKAGKMVLTFGG